MRPRQREIVDESRVRPEIDPAAEVERRIAFLVDYLEASGADGFVLGISGGVDSTLAGRIAQLACERHRQAGGDARFVGVRLPHGVQFDEDDAVAALEFVAPDDVVAIDIKPAVEGLAAEYERGVGTELSDFQKGNVKARTRMVAQYALAGERGLLVVGADHGAESVTGYFTKHGDGAADILPLSGLDKRQVRELLRHLGADERLWAKEPTADLLDEDAGLTDEDELGISYDHIDDYLEGREIPEEAAKALEDTWWASRHKRTMPVAVCDTWWRRSSHTGEGRSGDGLALVVIDMQNSYFEFPELAEAREELVPAVNELIATAHEADVPVVLVRTEHLRDGSTWTVNMQQDGEGFAFPGTEQAEFLTELEFGRHVEIVKTRDSAFHETDLADQLERLGVGRVLLCGVSTHSCVAQTAIDAFDHDVRASIAVDAVASSNAQLSDALLEFLSDEKRQPMLERSEGLDLLRGEAGSRADD